MTFCCSVAFPLGLQQASLSQQSCTPVACISTPVLFPCSHSYYQEVYFVALVNLYELQNHEPLYLKTLIPNDVALHDPHYSHDNDSKPTLLTGINAGGPPSCLSSSKGSLTEPR